MLYSKIFLPTQFYNYIDGYCSHSNRPRQEYTAQATENHVVSGFLIVMLILPKTKNHHQISAFCSFGTYQHEFHPVFGNIRVLPLP